MALAGLVWAAVLVVGLLAGVRLVPTWVAGQVVGVLVLPAFVVSALTGRARRWPGPGQFLDVLPRWVLPVAGGLALLFLLAGVTVFGSLGGVPGSRDGHYQLNQNGVVTVVDKATYEREVAREQRLVLGVFGLLGLFGATFTAATIARTELE